MQIRIDESQELRQYNKWDPRNLMRLGIHGGESEHIPMH